MATQLYPGATEPIWFGDRKVYSVTGFVSGVRSLVTDLPAFWVQGEISDFKHQKNLSMVYFTLKDPENGYTLRCTIGRTRFEALGIALTDGDTVHVFGRPDIYAPQGSFQLRAQSIEHTGRGLLMQQLEALKERLAAEGLFDPERKKPLPFLPRRVGVITGAEAAAQGDFLRNVSERFPPVKIAMCETLVQGDRAAPMLVAALRKLERIDDVDVIVLTRGGGAFEHFLPFSDERLCRAIAACPKPVVSAIGHEKDSPISDLVADLRVSTPTAAARTVVPDYQQIVRQLERTNAGANRMVRDRVTRRRQSVDGLNRRLAGRSPVKLVASRREHIAKTGLRSRAAIKAHIERRSVRSSHAHVGLRAFERILSDKRRAGLALVQTLRALSPSHTLKRGYAIVRSQDGSIVRDPATLSNQQRISMSFAEGSASATLTEVSQP